MPLKGDAEVSPIRVNGWARVDFYRDVHGPSPDGDGTDSESYGRATAAAGARAIVKDFTWRTQRA
jgi:hypothetical protein